MNPKINLFAGVILILNPIPVVISGILVALLAIFSLGYAFEGFVGWSAVFMLHAVLFYNIVKPCKELVRRSGWWILLFNPVLISAFVFFATSWASTLIPIPYAEV